MRAAAGLVLLIAGSCSSHEQVELNGDRSRAAIVAKLIAAAENGDKGIFARLTAKSTTMAGWLPPTMAEVDRRDEGCSLTRIDAALPKMAEAFWKCPTKNYKNQVERLFLIENGRVTHMWNDWSNGLL